MMCTEETQDFQPTADNENMFRIARPFAAQLTLLCLLLVPASAVQKTGRLAAGERHDLPQDAHPPTSIQFPSGPVGAGRRLVTAGELSVWARSRNLVLMDDCGLGGLVDGLAEVIPSTGLSFVLSASRARQFLYLDLVSFRPLLGYRPYLTPACSTARDQRSIADDGSVQLQKPFWIEVIVNGRLLKTLYQGGGTYIQSPVRITVEREIAQTGRLEVTLLPSPGDSFFAIWDVLVSESADLPAGGSAEDEGP